MATHDLVAELAGYKNELAGAKASKDTERVKDIKAEIDRVTAELRGYAAVLTANSVPGDPEVARVQAVLDDLDKDKADDEPDEDDKVPPAKKAAPVAAPVVTKSGKS